MKKQISARWNPDEACRPIIDEAPVFYPTVEVTIIQLEIGDNMSCLWLRNLGFLTLPPILNAKSELPPPPPFFIIFRLPPLDGGESPIITKKWGGCSFV